MKDPIKYHTLKYLLDQELLEKEETQKWLKLLPRMTDEQADQLITNIKNVALAKRGKKIFEAIAKFKEELKPLYEEEERILMEEAKEALNQETKVDLEKVREKLRQKPPNKRS